MSIQFNDLVFYKGLVQIYEKEAGFGRGDISGDVDKLKEFTADCNLALDDLFTIGFKAGGTWQLDDSNQIDYPFIKTDLVSGRRDYSFIKDGSGNIILDIYRVMVADPTGNFAEIRPVDQETPNNVRINTDSFINGKNVSGTPSRYDKTGNALFLDVVPNYNSAGGLEIYINREPSYFTYLDTVKMAGVPGNLHRYLALKPALDRARRKTLESYEKLLAEVQTYEQIIIPDTFGGRKKDEKRGMRANVECTR